MLVLEERKLKQIWDLVSKTPYCWIWQGGTDKDGYAKTWYKGKNLRVHRVIWSITNSKTIPKNMVILHTCDIPSCVNPNHLQLGTQKENMMDKKRKGRCATGDNNGMRKFPKLLAGEKCGTSKLTEKQVLEIRDKHKNGITGRELAKQYMVWPSQISNIINRKQWNHI